MTDANYGYRVGAEAMRDSFVIYCNGVADAALAIDDLETAGRWRAMAYAAYDFIAPSPPRDLQRTAPSDPIPPAQSL